MTGKAKITTSIDSDLKYMFESVKLPDSSYSKLLEDAIRAYIMSVSPEELLKRDILELEHALMQRRTCLEELELASKRQRRLQDFQQEQLERYMPERLEKYHGQKKPLAVQIKKGILDWRLASKVYYFNGDIEACRAWIMARLQEDGLL